MNRFGPRQFGGDWDFSEVKGDAFYQCMTVNVLGAVADVFCVGIRKGEDLWEILGLRASTGETVWVAEGTEPLLLSPGREGGSFGFRLWTAPSLV